MLSIVSALWLVANGAAADAAEVMRFVITRNGEPIGTHTVELSRAGTETTVNVTTDLTVKVLFLVAYRLHQKETERWSNGRLVALNSVTDDNGARHKIAVRTKGTDLELDADGNTSRLDKGIVPSSLWNREFLQHAVILDTQDGQVMPVSAVDGGMDRLVLGSRKILAHHYTVKGRYSEDVWYDEDGRLVQKKIIGSDGSIILFQPA